MTTPAISRRGVRRLGALLAAITAAVAGAYVLEAAAILERLADQRDDLRLFQLRVDGAATFHGPAAEEAAAALALVVERGEVQSEAAVLLKPPARCRFELAPLAGTPLAAVVARGTASHEGAPVRAVQVALDEICALLAGRSSSGQSAAATLERHLRARGVQVGAQTALSRFGGEVVYVLGGREAPARMYVYKDSFLPARIQFTDADGAAWDVRFFDFTSPATGEWFPRSVEVVKDGTLAMRFVGFDADARSKLDDALFSAEPPPADGGAGR